MLNGTVCRAVAAAQRANADVINRIADMVESWANRNDIPDVVGRAGAAAWGDVETAMQANNDLLLSYIDGPPTTVAHPALPPAEPPAEVPAAKAPPAPTPAPIVDGTPESAPASPPVSVPDPTLQPTI